MPMMTPALRKGVLTAHVVSSVGWVGAVAGFLALAVAELTHADADVPRGAYLSMDLMAEYVILPLAVGSFATGILCSLGTGWGLVRYYWVLVKLLMSLLCTVVFLMHLQLIKLLATLAVQHQPFADAASAQHLMVIASIAALAALLVITALSVYKPRGMTPYGARRQHLDQVPT